MRIMVGVNWHSILTAAKLMGTAAVLVGITALLIFDRASKTQRRLARYKKTGHIWDWFKVFLK